MNQSLLIINFIYFILSLGMIIVFGLLYLNFKYDASCGQTINILLEKER